MQHFLKIAEGVDVVPLLNALAVNPDLWNENPLRTTHPASPHHEVDDILVFFNKIPEDPASVVDDIDVIPYRAWAAIPQVRPLVHDLMRRVEGVRLGRVMITRLAPGKGIPDHADQGAPAEYYQRYQLALQCQPGVKFQIGEEVIQFRMGEWWWIDNRTEHSVFNGSADDRIVLIVDVRIC